MIEILLAMLLWFKAFDPDPELMWAAQARADYMAQTQQCSHHGLHAYHLVLASGQPFTDGGETVSCTNDPDEGAAVWGFYYSPAHWSLLMEWDLTQIGIGVAWGANGIRYTSVVVTD